MWTFGCRRGPSRGQAQPGLSQVLLQVSSWYKQGYFWGFFGSERRGGGPDFAQIQALSNQDEQRSRDSRGSSPVFRDELIYSALSHFPVNMAAVIPYSAGLGLLTSRLGRGPSARRSPSRTRPAHLPILPKSANEDANQC